MKALVIYKGGTVKVEDIAEPQVKPGYVKIRVAACGICGSDIPRVLDNKAHYYPIVLGHEFSGIVAETGAGVTSVEPGDHVAGVPLIPCGHCEDCVRSNYSLCRNYTFIGSRLQGAMAEYVLAPQQNVVKLSDVIDLQDAALIEPLTVALHALKQNNHKAGKKVAVLGMGTIGCLTAQTAKHTGAQTVTAVVRNRKYDTLIRKMGMDSIVDTSEENWMERVMQITGDRGFDFVYETAGSVQTMQQAFLIAGNKANICFVGTPKKELVFSVQQWELMNRKEFYLTGSWMSYSGKFPGTEWEDAVKFLEKGYVKIYPELIHRKVKLEDSANIFDDYKNGGTIAGRNLLVMSLPVL
jgi:L-iditol 2-dehydrogenase